MFALGFGGLLVAAGILLFVSANWNQMSPSSRVAAVVSMAAAFHVGGALAAGRFEALAVTLHAVGTIALGAGIFLVGQIHHLDVHWPAGVKARGEFRPQIGHIMDVMRTLVAVGGAPYPTERHGVKIQPMEGRSLLPALAKQPVGRDTPLCFEHEGSRAVRDGKWKLISLRGEAWELYDLEADPTEMNNLRAREPAQALRDAGSGATAAFLYGTLPVVLPQFVSYALYRWEYNLRMAAVLGFVVSKPFGSSQNENAAARAPSAELGIMEAADTAVSELPGPPPLGQAVVKTADLSLEVDKGDFASAFDHAAVRRRRRQFLAS